MKTCSAIETNKFNMRLTEVRDIWRSGEQMRAMPYLTADPLLLAHLVYCLMPDERIELIDGLEEYLSDKR